MFSTSDAVLRGPFLNLWGASFGIPMACSPRLSGSSAGGTPLVEVVLTFAETGPEKLLRDDSGIPEERDPVFTSEPTLRETVSAGILHGFPETHV